MTPYRYGMSNAVAGKVLVTVTVALAGCALSVARDDSQCVGLDLPALSGVAEGIDVHTLEAAVAHWNAAVGAPVFWEDAHDTVDPLSVVVSVGVDVGVALVETDEGVLCDVVLERVDSEALHRDLGLCLGVEGDLTDAHRAMLMDRIEAE
jgi:hypothetical protein